MVPETSRQRRHQRTRARLAGTAERPRVSVYRSNRQVLVQLIDDSRGVTIAAVEGRTIKAPSKIAQAKKVGQRLATLATGQGIMSVVFDRSGYQYHGRVKALADGLREGGLKV